MFNHPCVEHIDISFFNNYKKNVHMSMTLGERSYRSLIEKQNLAQFP